MKGKEVIDIECNLGDSSTYFALRGASKVISLVPFLNTNEASIKNINANNQSDKVQLMLAGCSASCGYITTNSDHNRTVGTGIHEGIPTFADIGPRIPLLTLNDILVANGTPDDVILKIDCE